MKNININYSLSSAVTQTIFQPSISLKGQTEVTYLLYDINEDINNVLFLDINWGDGSSVVNLRRNAVYDYRTQSIFDEILYGKIGGSVCTPQKHVYNNNTITYGVALTATFTLYYDNGAITTIYQPHTLYWASFYDDITELVAINTQIQPVSTNRTFVNLESKRNIQTLPSLLDITGLPVRREFEAAPLNAAIFVPEVITPDDSEYIPPDEIIIDFDSGNYLSTTTLDEYLSGGVYNLSDIDFIDISIIPG